MEFKNGRKAFSNDILYKMNKSHAGYFILGDLKSNTNIFFMASNYSSDYLNTFTSNSVTSLINKPTRVTPSATIIIDHVLTNENFLIHYPLVINHTLTDRYPIKISSQKTNNTCKNQCNLSHFSEHWKRLRLVTGLMAFKIKRTLDAGLFVFIDI